MPLLLVFLFLISSVLSTCPSTSYPKWSTLSISTGAGVDVTLSQNVVLDQNITVNRLIFADGIILVVDPTKDVLIRARYIEVGYQAQFWIGGENCPYTKNAEIIFTGPYVSSPNGFGDKGMGVYGQVEWHGAPTNPTWTNLAKTAEIGSKSITLAVSVPWKIGSQIVIASTDFDEFQSEVVTITGVSGNVVSFTEPLKFMHWGEQLKYVDERAEVGLLTKNIKVHGEQDPSDSNTIQGPRFGGHTMYVTGSTAHLENVQFYNMGQAGELARYPVHFHNAKSMAGSYVKQCAFPSNFQRCITIHATDNLLIEDNVAYNSSGHCYFWEDGIEQGNTANHNLGVVANVVADDNLRIIPSDKTQTAVFWITHPNNTITNNVAVGGSFGFWYALPQHPIGLTGSTGDHAQDTWPRYTNMGMGQFRGNKAHSTDSGLFVDQGPAADGQTSALVSYSCRTFNLDPDFAKSLSASQLTTLDGVLADSSRKYPALFEDFTAHHCSQNAAWLRGDNMVVDGFYSSNSLRAITMPGGPNLIQNAVIVGDSKNPGNPSNKAAMQGRSRFFSWDVTYPMLGLQHYDCCGPNFIRNVLFVNFTDFNFVFTGATRKTGAVTFLNGEHPIPPNTRFWNIKFEHVTNRVFYVPDPNFRTALKYAFLVDGDGSFTGECGSVISPNNPLLLRPACKAVSSWNGYSCPPNTISPRYIEVSDAVGTDYITALSGSGDLPAPAYANETVTAVGLGKLLVIRIDDQKSNWINGVQVDGLGNATHAYYEQNYRQNLPTQTEYLYLFPTDYGTPKQLRMQAYNMPLGEWFRIVVPYPPGTTFNYRNQSTYANLPPINCADNINHPEWGNCTLKSVNSKSALVANSYFWDNSLGLLWIQMQPTSQSFSSSFGYTWPDSAPGAYITATCPNNNCTISYQQLQSLLDYANPLWISPKPYVPPPTNLCYTNGYGNKGSKMYNELGTPEVMFDDALAPGWQLPSWSYLNMTTQSSMAVSGNALQLRLNNYGQFWIRTGYNSDFALSKIADPGVPGAELALIFDIRIGAPASLINSLTVQRRDVVRVVATLYESDVATSSTQKRSYSINVNSPDIFGQGPIDSTQWYHVVIPWSQWTAGGVPNDFTNLMGVSIGISEGFPSTLYVDNVKLQYVASSFTAKQMPTFENLAQNPTDPVSPLVPVDALTSGCTPCTPGKSTECQSPSSSSSGIDGKVGAIIAFAILFAISTGVAIYFYLQLQQAKQIPQLELNSPTSPTSP